MSKFIRPDQPPPYTIEPQMQGTTIVQPPITNQPVQQQQQVVNTIQILQTGCNHNFGTEFTCCGILCAIFLFPIGLICCFCMRKKRCRNCKLYV